MLWREAGAGHNAEHMASHRLEGEPALSAGHFVACAWLVREKNLMAVTLQRLYAE